MSDTNTFAELAATGATASFELPGDVNEVDVYLKDGADDGTGTLKMQTSFDGGTTWVDVPTASWTSGDGLLGSYTTFGRDVRFDLAGATSPSDVIVTIVAKPVASYVEYLGPLTANGNTDLVLSKPGKFAIFAKGTWDSGSLTVSETPDGSSYFDTGVAAITANGGGEYANSADNSTMRLVLASVVTAADLDVWAYVTSE